MRTIVKVLFILSLITACASDLEYWSIKDFQIVEGALPDKDKVQVIYYLAGPKTGDQIDFYSHAIAISSSLKDTFNILTFQDIDISQFSNSNYDFIYNDHPVLSKFANDFVQKSAPQIDTSKIEWSKYEKVVRDPTYDYLTSNNHKTVIGSLTNQ